MPPLNLTFYYAGTSRKKQLNTRGSSAGKALVGLRVNYLKRDIHHSTDIYLLPGEWDEENRCVSKKHRNHQNLNRILLELKHSIEDFETELRLKGEAITLERVKQFLKGGDTLLEFVESEFSAMTPRKPGDKKGHSQNYLIKHKKLLAYLKAFTAEQGQIRLKQVSASHLRDFEKFLQRQPTGKNATGILGQATVGLNMAIFKTYFKLAKKRGLLTKDPFDTFEIDRGESKTTDALTMQEVQQFAAYQSNDPAIIQQRDLFELRCYLGMRDTDGVNLKVENFYETPGGLRINYTPQKVEKYGVFVDVNIDLLFDGRPGQIVRQYIEGKQAGKLFDLVPTDNKKRNTIIKAIAAGVGITKNIHTHVARYTAESLLESKGLPLHTISDMLGHKSVTMTKKYRSNEGFVKDELLK